jgi:hypothetical protein
MGPHDAADVLVAVEYVVVVGAPLVARSGFGGAFQDEHGGSLAVIAAATQTPRGERSHAVGAHVAEGHKSHFRSFDVT